MTRLRIGYLRWFVLALVAAIAMLFASSAVPSAGSTVSPLIFGANMDYRIASNISGAVQYDVQTLRVANNVSDFAGWLNQVHSAGIQPLVILRGCGTPDPTLRLSQNVSLVQTTQQIFGANTRAFYEIGNENDLECGVTSGQYVTMWNAMVPRLKQLAPNSWFGGPVNFQQNPSYVAYFVHNATPKPDFVSWHEYTCNSVETSAVCIQHIANWTTHITNTRNSITANGDAVPPIMITEWNYAPDGGVTTDNKHNDATFMKQWTTAALQTLIANNVYASYQFNVSDATQLIGSPQGAAFQSMYQQTFGGSTTPTSTAIPTPTSKPTATPTATRSTQTPTPVLPTSTPVATATPAATAVPSPTNTPVVTATASATNTPAATATATRTPTITSTATAVPPTAKPTVSPTATPTQAATPTAKPRGRSHWHSGKAKGRGEG